MLVRICWQDELAHLLSKVDNLVENSSLSGDSVLQLTGGSAQSRIVTRAPDEAQASVALDFDCILRSLTLYPINDRRDPRPIKSS